MTFNEWWNTNKDLYLQVGVKEEVARSIWTAAALAVETNLYRMNFIKKL